MKAQVCSSHFTVFPSLIVSAISMPILFVLDKINEIEIRAPEVKKTMNNDNEDKSHSTKIVKALNDRSFKHKR